MTARPQKKGALVAADNASEDKGKRRGWNDPDDIVDPSNTASLEDEKGAYKKRPVSTRGDDVLDKMLFDDDTKGGEILKGLISSQGLKTAWEKLVKRMRSIEEAAGVRKERSAMNQEELDKAFASRKECREITIEEYEGRLVEQEKRLAALEAASEAALRRFEANEKDVSQVHDELAKHWETIGVVQQDVLKVEQQDCDHHEAMITMMDELRQEIGLKEADNADVRQSMADRQGKEEHARAELREKLQELKDFLYSAGLQKQLEQITSDMLSEYVSWKDMAQEREQIHTRAVDEATAPLQKNIQELTNSMEVSHTNLANKDTAINTDLLTLGEKVGDYNQKLLDRIDDVVTMVHQRAMDTRLSDVENRLIARDEYHEIDFAEFKELQTRKIEETFDRVQELESSIFAHEHALEHWAEEIGNRATKYDMMVLSSRVDKCSLKDKTDADYKETVKTLKWQSVKIENLTFKSSFGGDPSSPTPPADPSPQAKAENRRSSTRKSTDGSTKEAQGSKHSTEVEDAPAPKSKPASRAGSKSSTAGEERKDSKANVGSAGEAVQMSPNAEATSHVAPAVPAVVPVPQSAAFAQPESEMMAMFQQQLESLAHGILGLSHATLRVAVCGHSREARRDREDRLIFHINSLLYWIMHRTAPPNWDPMELTTLGLKCMESSTEEKRKERTHTEVCLSRPRTSTSPTNREGNAHVALPEDSNTSKSQRIHLSRADTWLADHLHTALHAHDGHLPMELAQQSKCSLVSSGSELTQHDSIDMGPTRSLPTQRKKESHRSMAKARATIQSELQTFQLRPSTANIPASTENGSERMRGAVMEIFGNQNHVSGSGLRARGNPCPRTAPAPGSNHGSTPESEGAHDLSLPRLATGSLSAR